MVEEPVVAVGLGGGLDVLVRECIAGGRYGKMRLARLAGAAHVRPQQRRGEVAGVLPRRRCGGRASKRANKRGEQRGSDEATHRTGSCSGVMREYTIILRPCAGVAEPRKSGLGR